MTEAGEQNLPVPADGRRPAPEAGRRLSDEEAAEILKRAARDEVRSNLPAPHDSTVEDLMAAAGEVGLDPAAVRRAAAVRPAPENQTQGLALGGQLMREVRSVIPGPIPGSRRAMAAVAESVLGGTGRVVKDEEDRWVWEGGRMGTTRISLSEEDGRTSMTLRGGRADVLVRTYLAGLLGLAAVSSSFGLFAAAVGSVGALVALLGLFGIPALMARPFFSRADRRLKDGLEHLAMEIARVADEERLPRELPPGN